MMGSQTCRSLNATIMSAEPPGPRPNSDAFGGAGAVENLPNLWTDTWPPNSTAIAATGDSSWGVKCGIQRVRRSGIVKKQNRCGELAKEANPPFLAEIYRKVAVRYVFMAEELLKGRARDEDAIERADRMISRLRPDGEAGGHHAGESSLAGTH
jgi:hypothetical protein